MKLFSTTAQARDPRYYRLAAALGISHAAAVGHCHLLRLGVLELYEDGDLRSADPEDLARYGEWPGDPMVFVEALVDSGVLARDPDLRVDGWHEEQGDLIERRARARDKKRKQREKGRKRKNGVPLGVPKAVPASSVVSPSELSPGTSPSLSPKGGGTVPPESVVWKGTEGNGLEGNGPERNGTGGAGPDGEIIAAVHHWDPTFPEVKIREQVTRALRLGYSKAQLLADVKARGDRLRIWTIVDEYQYPARRNGSGSGKTRENAPVEKPPVLAESSKVAHHRQDEARKKVAEAIATLSPEDRDSLRLEAEAKADSQKGITEPMRAAFIESEILTRAAEKFGIEGV